MSSLVSRAYVFLLLLMAVVLLPLPVKAEAPPSYDIQKPLIAAIPADFPPTYFRDPATGQPVGLAVEVMNEVAKRAGLTITYRFAKPWQEIEDLLLQGEVDLIPFRVMSEKTTSLFLFTSQLDSTAVNYIVNANDQKSTGPKAGQKVGVIQGSGAHDYLKKHPELTPVLHHSLEHLLVDILSGQIDMGLTVTPNMLQLAENLGFTERIRVITPAEFEIKRGIALRRGNEQLQERLNKAIADFHNTPESVQIYKKWLGKPKPYWTAKRTGLTLGSLFLVVAAVLISWHMTTLRRANRRLKAEQTFLQTMIDAVPDFIFFKDRNSLYLGCNQTFAERVHGRSKETLSGLGDGDLHSQPDLVATFKRTDRDVLESGQPIKFELDVPLKDGNLIRAEVIKVPYRDDTGQVIGVIGIARDITDRFKQQQQLEESRERAEVASRAKSQFLANMSHEIRTPLNGVLGMAQLLTMSTLDQDQQEYVGMILSSGQNLLSILNDILDLAKIEADMLQLACKPFSPAEIITETVSFYRHPCSQKGIKLAAELGQNLPTAVVGDSQRIKQILFNLLGNAVKFTQRGRVSLGCSLVSSDSDQVRLQFAVCDTGIGISPEDQGRIFTPFEQVDNSNTREYGGTGLGLSICSRLTQMMEGTLELESAPGKGSCFRLTLGLKTVPAGDLISSPAASVTDASDGEVQLTILVAEDNEINRIFLVKLLRRMGHHPLEAEDGRQALDVLKQYRCDLVLLDIQMPVLDGCRTLEEIRQRDLAHKCHTPVIALTAYAMSGDREKFLDQGFDDYLAKPLQDGDLEAAIKSCRKRIQSV